MNDVKEIRDALEVFDNPPNSTGEWEDDRTVGVALSVLAAAARAYVELVESGALGFDGLPTDVAERIVFAPSRLEAVRVYQSWLLAAVVPVEANDE